MCLNKIFNMYICSRGFICLFIVFYSVFIKEISLQRDVYLIFFFLGIVLLLDVCVGVNVGIIIMCFMQDMVVDLMDQMMVDEIYKVELCNLVFGDYVRIKLEVEKIVLVKYGL